MTPDETPAPPHAPEAERAALGCLVLEPEHAAKRMAGLTRAMFYEPANLTVFDAIATLIRDGKAPDTVTLCQRLADTGKLAEVGGHGFIAALPDAAPFGSAFESHANVLRDKLARRRLLDLTRRAESFVNSEGQDLESIAREFSDYARQMLASHARRRWFHFHTPGELRDWQVPSGYVLVGDCALVRGGFTVLGGAPGVGKSRATTGLAFAGARGRGAEWFGLPVHAQFKTAILQCENGRYRLKQEFAAMHSPELDDFIRVSDRPDFGLAFDAPDFRHALADFLAEFAPGLLILDPWNAIARDDAIRDYRAALENIMEALPRGAAAPAVLIVSHTRKPKGDDRKRGRALLHELAGSYALGSAARTVFVLQTASDDPADDRVVFTCAKNNDGSMGTPTAWQRGNGLFVPCADFDWQEFEQPAATGNGSVSEADVEALFDAGRRKLARKLAVSELMESTKLGKTACYNALRPDGRFGQHLREDDNGNLTWKL